MSSGIELAPGRSSTESGATTTAPGSTLYIEPATRFPSLDLPELWAYRGLLFFLVWRDIKVRYAQTILGAGWAILQPLLTTVVFTVIFGRFANIPSDGLPYPVFSLAALVPWTYFSTALTGASNSLVASSNLLTKVYFPRLVIPFAPVLASTVDFAIGLGLLVAVMLGYGVVPSWSALLITPLLLVMMMTTAAGLGCWLSALNIQYRDVKYAVPFMVQVWMYASPIIYSLSSVPEEYHTVFALNPMVGVIQGFRSVFLGSGPIPFGIIGISALAATTLFISGILYFRRMESVFADVA